MKLIAATVAALLAASAANAVIVTSAPGAPDQGAPGQVVVVDFDGPNAAGYSFGTGLVITNTTTSAAAAPAGVTNNYGYVSANTSPTFTTLSTPGVRSISFYWGSIDPFNEIDVIFAGGQPTFTIAGGEIPPANGNQDLPTTNRRVFFNAEGSELITGLTFRSTGGVAFEFDTISAAVPEPQQWAMLLAGFGLVGAAARRKNRAMQVVAA